MSILEANRLDLWPPDPTPLSFFKDGNKFQNRRVSSPAPVTMLEPQGLMPRYKTLYVCPDRVATFYIVGYFQMII